MGEAMNWNREDSPRGGNGSGPSVLKILMGLAIATAALCFITALIVGGKGKRIYRGSIPAEGGTSGSFKIEEPHTVCRLEVYCNLSTHGVNKWNWVGIELLNADKEALFGLGDEFWAEHGYWRDDYGRRRTWRERKRKYQARFVIRRPGTYYLSANTEMSSPAAREPIKVALYTGTASRAPLIVGGLVFLVMSVILLLIANAVQARQAEERRR